MPEQTQPTETPQKQEPPKQSIQKKPFWKFILIFGILLLVIALGYMGSKFSKDGTISLPNFSQIELPDKGYADNSVLVLLDTYKKPDDKYTIFRVQLDGSGENEIWSNTFINDYQFSPLDFPSVSNDRKLLLYEEENDFLIIDSSTGKERRIPKHHRGFHSDLNCVWNNSNIKIACILREEKANDYTYILSVVDISSGKESLVKNSNKDKTLFFGTSMRFPIAWDSADKNFFVYGKASSGDVSLFGVNVDTGAVKSQKVDGDLTNSKYSPELNKFIYRNIKEDTIYALNPSTGKSEVLYQKSDHFMGRPILSSDGKEIIFQETDFKVDFFNPGVDPKDGVPTSKIIKINLETREKNEFKYPFDPESEEGIFSIIAYYNSSADTIIITDLEFSDFDDSFDQSLYSFNLKSKKLIKIFSRNSNDVPGWDLQFDVIP